MYRFLLLAVPALAAAPHLAAQTSYGRLTGRITDSQQAVVANAAARLTHIETNTSVQMQSNQDGLIEFENLVPGNYVLVVEAPGFKRYERTGLGVRVGDVVAVSVQLEVGSIAESVQVSAEAPLLEAASANLDQLVTNRQVISAPLAGRGVTYLMQLSPGVVSLNPPMHGWLPQARGSVSDFSIAGTVAYSSEFTLDGIPNMDRTGVIAFQPPPDMIQEFRVQTAPYDATLGHFSGAAVTMVMKSGGNDFHGSLFFSNLSRPMMTHPFFVNKQIYDLTTGPVTDSKISRYWPATRTNLYRVQVTAPVFLPKIYDGRNRTFVSYGNDYMQRSFANLATDTVPTAAERRGDFSALLALGPQYQIYDPATIAPAANGRFSRQPLPGNVIAASRLNPVAQNILNYYPLPNVGGTVDGINNFFSSTASTISYMAHMGRIDQVLNERQRFYGSFNYMDNTGNQGHNLSNNGLGNISETAYRGLALDYVDTLSSTTVLDLRYGMTRVSNLAGPPTQGLNLSSLGFPSSFTSLLDQSLTALPQINIAGYAAIGSNLISTNAFTTHFFSGSLSKTHGEHTFRVGGEYRMQYENSTHYGNYSGNLTFDPAWTQGPLDNSPPAPIGQGLAAFILGLPTSGHADVNNSIAEKSTFTALYFQDDWKVSRKLTVSLGLRWEIEGPTTERYNRANHGFDYQSVNPANAAAQAAYAQNPVPQLPVSQFQLRGGLLFAGVGGQPRGLWNESYRDLAPRVGAAYSLNPETVVRAGYGIYYGSLGVDRNDVGLLGFNQQTLFNPSNNNGQTFLATLSNPFPNGLLKPPGAAGGLATYLGLTPSYFNPQLTLPYMQRWSLNFQRQFGSRWLVEVGYIGNRGNHLPVTVSPDAVPVRYLSTSPVRDPAAINFNTQNVANPFRGIPAFSNSPTFFNNQTLQLSQLLLPYPQYALSGPAGSGINTMTATGFSWYHALEARFERRFGYGLLLNGQYTFSKFMQATELLNPEDLQPTHVISPLDRPQHLALSGTWDIPVGRGQHWWTNSSRAADAVFGGWNVNVIYQATSGPPLAFGDVLYTGSLADIVLPSSQRNVEQWFNPGGFNRVAAQQLAWNLREFPLRLTGARGNGINNWDISLTKYFSIRENVKLQLRGEAVDALNHPMFSPPNTTPASTAFGTVTSTIWTEQKKITVGAKLTW